MKVKITDKLICIPPYVSTTWDQVAYIETEAGLEGEDPALLLHLKSGEMICIPDLDSSVLEIVFTAHMKFLENASETKEEPQAKSPAAFLQGILGISPDQMTAFPIRFGPGGLPEGLESMEMAFQHNPDQADTADMPEEVIKKIAEMAHLFAQGDTNALPKPEPHCNCMHCQIARAIHGETKESAVEQEEEPISEEDLSFRSWDIEQTGEELYTVTNPLDAKEHYSVFLGTPVGCTCGQTHCEHIQAVLRS